MEHGLDALASGNANNLSAIEQLFPEPSDNGLAEQLNDFWNAWASVANDPGSSSGSTAARTVLLQKASAVTTHFNSLSASLQSVADTTDQSLASTVQNVNSDASQLAALNARIVATTATGADANGLLDQRDRLLDDLASRIGAVPTLKNDGTVDVDLGGVALVSGTTAATMSVDSSYNVSIDGAAVTLASGSAAADLQTLTTDIPAYQAQLDSVAFTLATQVNDAQAAGYDLDGNAGGPMFAGTTAATIGVAITDPAQIAASGTPGGNLDGSNAASISQFGSASSGADAAYSVLVGNIGAASALAQQKQSTQDAITTSVDALRSSVSGVSYDEEVSNMVTYQQAFQASSRVLTTIDSMLDTLINHTGMVGMT
jgi:flagellar hook-associated protein 1 FlgK